MPESRLDVLDRIYAGWGGGDFRAGSENLADDVQLVVDRNIPDGGVYVGPDGGAATCDPFSAPGSR